MMRIDTATRAVDLHGTGKDGWRDGIGAATLAPTRGRAAWFNAIQEEVAVAIEESGETLDGGISGGQLARAIRKIASSFPVISSLEVRATATSHTYDFLKDVCYAPDTGATADGAYVAVGHFISGSPGSPSGTCWYSYDGLIWAQLSTGVTGYHSGIAYGNGYFIIVGSATPPEPRIYFMTAAGGSLTNVDITALSVGSASNALNSVCYDPVNTCFVAVGDSSASGLALMYSNSTGTAWTMATPANSYLGDLQKVIATPTGVFACGTDGVIQRSTDGGATWTEVHNDNTLGTLKSMTYVNGAILVSTSQQRTILRSIDNGATWTESATPIAIEPAITDAVIEHVGAFNALAFAVVRDALTERRRILVSLDRGATWPYVVRCPSTTFSPPTFIYAASATDTGRLVIVGYSNAVATAVAMCSTTGAPEEL